MRKTALTLLTLGLAAMIATPALAVPFWTENFSYPDGGLVAVAGGLWATHSGTGTDIQVVSGIANGDMLSFPDDNRAFPTRLATDNTYASFKVMIPTQSVAVVQNYFAHFYVNTTTFVAKTFLSPAGSAYTFGITVNQNAPLPGAAGVIWPTTLAYGVWYTVVLKYDATAGTATLWVDPLSEGSTSITSTQVVAAGALVAGFGLRESNSTSTAWQWRVDDLIVGPSFADVMGTVAVEKTTWGHVKGLYR